jgi:hypothetical protein
MRGLLLCAVAVATLGCAPVGHTPNEETILIKASALTKLSAAAESAVRYKDAPGELTDRVLLQWATSHDPALLAPFSAYTLKVLRQVRHAVVLVCTEDGTIALLEDAGCTAELDRHRWRDTPGAVCGFSIEPRVVCAGP